jgi:uncharacterized protein
MRQKIALKLTPAQAADAETVKQQAAQEAGVAAGSITGFIPLKQSVDARSRQVWVNLSLDVFINEPFIKTPAIHFDFKDVNQAAEKVIIIGAGPAGLFAALQLIEKGIQPIILERGKDVRARRRDLAQLNKEGIVNPESNYCFGEGGAGTYSDGKLYTRSNKRGSIDRILNLLVHFGAPENILYEAHPHIGTNKLPGIITAMRQQITSSGGIFLFEEKVTGFDIDNSRIRAVTTAAGNRYQAGAVILATGHSARDIFILLHQKNILIEAKPFALGVRVEHPQALIDSIQYKCPLTENNQLPGRGAYLPPASYSLVQQVQQKGVFSFCMCPGGIIAPAATNPGELVVNGWSPSKRNNAYANSGLVVEIKETDWMTDPTLAKKNIPAPLMAMYFQQAVEQKAFAAGGGGLAAPAQRMTDFVNAQTGTTLPGCSYLPGIVNAPLQEVLPALVYESLQKAFVEFGRKMRGYYTNEAVVVATESRTSSPVKIPRQADTLTHPQVHNLYPCGEGAGYAGGIVSAAMDGEKVALRLFETLKTPFQPSHPV